MRDPSVQALHCISATAEEVERGELLRAAWPVRRIRRCVVGLAVDGRVIGEAPLKSVRCLGVGRVFWALGPVRLYRVPPPAPDFGTAQARPMPVMPLGSGPEPPRPAFEW